jgi:asparagine synthase (glutamine-hydrolysing)
MVAAMARAGGTIRTFTLGFPPEYAHFDERRYARLVAERYGTDHEEIVVEPRVEDTIQTLARVFDEPLGDSGAVPNFLVCRAARRRLTVALSGLGGDELGGGYQRYLGGILAEWYRRLPRAFRGEAARRVLDWIPESTQGHRWLDQAKRFLRHSALEPADRFLAFSSPLEAERRRRLYQPALLERVDFDSSAALMRALFDEQPEADLANRLMGIDLQTYMVDDLLAVADRVSMAVSLEVRVPFLDHPLVEFMATVPGDLKIRGLRKKYLLKKAFARDLPPALLNRRKSGFSLPVARWLREDLRGMLEDVLSPARLERDGLFDPSVVEALKREHYARERNWSGALWGLLMFHLWQDNYRSGDVHVADHAPPADGRESVQYAYEAR